MLKRIVERDALAAPAYLAMGLLWKKQGRLAEATSALRRARFLFGDDSWLAPYTPGGLPGGARRLAGGAGGLPARGRRARVGRTLGAGDSRVNEQDFASTVLESCSQRMGTLQSRT